MCHWKTWQKKITGDLGDLDTIVLPLQTLSGFGEGVTKNNPVGCSAYAIVDVFYMKDNVIQITTSVFGPTKFRFNLTIGFLDGWQGMRIAVGAVQNVDGVYQSLEKFRKVESLWACWGSANRSLCWFVYIKYRTREKIHTHWWKTNISIFDLENMSKRQTLVFSSRKTPSSISKMTNSTNILPSDCHFDLDLFSVWVPDKWTTKQVA